MGRCIAERMEFNERTPLIATVRVAPPQQRYQHNVVRRFCSIALGSSLIALFIVFLCTSFALVPHGYPKPKHPHPRPYPPSKDYPNSITFQELQEILLETPNGEKAMEWSQYYTSGPHLAGKNYSQALWTQEKWQEFGIQAEIVAYDTYINYPLGHRLALYENMKTKDEVNSWEVKFEASLEEAVLEEDPTTGLENRVPTFNGYSASGNVTAPYVYVNYGAYADFEDLVKANVTLKGKIAIARYGGVFRGLKIKRAEELGMVGCVLFTDPGDDGAITKEKGEDEYPNGPARNPSSVQRGSVQFLSTAPGDP
jgi:N-acetylated-alpha-linked acidic dipeptidase